MAVKMLNKLCVLIICLINDSIGFKNTTARPKDVGDPCDWEGVRGNCIDYWTCVTNAIDATHGKYPPVCSFEGNLLKTCCTSCTIVANISSTIIIEDTAFERNGKPSHDKCLEYLKIYGWTYRCYNKRFAKGDFVKVFDKEDDCVGYNTKGSRGVGGEDARRAEYPHMLMDASKIRVTFLSSSDVELTQPNQLIISMPMCWERIRQMNGLYVFGSIALVVEIQNGCLNYIKQYRRFYKCYFKAYGNGEFTKSYIQKDNCFGIGMAGYHGVGGEDARRAEYPHMALLGYGEDRESAQWLCGGSLISEWFILTAAHCRSNQVDEVQFVALGILKRTDPPSLWQVYGVDIFVPYPEYKPPSKYHDIALIRTNKRIEFSNVVLPACLSQGDESDEAMETAYATGWGALGYRKRIADVLQKVKVNRFRTEQCWKQYPPHRHLRYGFHNTTQLCYGDSDIGRDTCEGDSGGPLQLDTQTICPQIIIGVTSAGHPCGFAGTAGLYTKVTYYLPWIEGIVWP